MASLANKDSTTYEKDNHANERDDEHVHNDGIAWINYPESLNRSWASFADDSYADTDQDEKAVLDAADDSGAGPSNW